MNGRREHIAWMLAQGDSRDAIEEWIALRVDAVDRDEARADLRDLLTEAEAEAAANRGRNRDDVPAGQVQAEKARRKRAGEPYGYSALGRHFNLSEGAIRDRLGVRRRQKTPGHPPDTG